MLHAENTDKAAWNSLINVKKKNPKKTETSKQTGSYCTEVENEGKHLVNFLSAPVPINQLYLVNALGTKFNHITNI